MKKNNKKIILSEIYKNILGEEKAGDIPVSPDEINTLLDKVIKGYFLSRKKGTTQEVAAYQTFLNSVGRLGLDREVEAPLDVDGDYGEKTMAKTKGFQSLIDGVYEHKVSEGDGKDTDTFNSKSIRLKKPFDGEFGPKTLRMLLATGYASAFDEDPPSPEPFTADGNDSLINSSIDPKVATHLTVLARDPKSFPKSVFGKEKAKSKETKKTSKDSQVETQPAVKGAIDSTQYDVLPDPDSGKSMGKSYSKIPRPQFVKKFGPLAIKAVQGTGVFPSTVLAQAALESGWATKRLGDNGLFGVKGATRRNGQSIPHKPRGAWKGKVGLFRTTEKVGSKKISVKRYFRIYDTIEDSFKDHIDVLLKSRYSKALAATDPGEQVMEIGEAGYAAKGDKGNTYGPYLRDKMLPGIIREMKKQGISNEKGGGAAAMSENKKALKAFIKLLKEETEYERTGTVNMEAEAEAKGLGQVLADQGFQGVDLNMEKESANLVDGKVLLKIEGDKTYLYAADLAGEEFHTIKYKNFKPGGGNNWISLSAPKYKKSVDKIKRKGKNITPSEANAIKGGSATTSKELETPSGAGNQEQKGVESEVVVEGEEFVVNGMRFKSVPTPEVAKKAEELYATAEKYAKKYGENFQQRNWEKTRSGLEFLTNHMYGSSPAEKIKMRGGGYQDSDSGLTKGQHVLNGTWAGIPVGKRNNTPENRAAMDAKLKKMGYRASKRKRLIQGVYDNPKSGGTLASGDKTAWSSPFWKRCHEKYLNVDGISNSQLEYNHKRALTLRKNLEKNPESFVGKTMFLLFKGGGQGKRVKGSHPKESWERVPILKGDSQVEYNSNGTFDGGTRSEQGHMNVYLDDGKTVMGGNMSGKILKKSATGDQSFESVFGIFKRVKFLGMEETEGPLSENKKIIREFFKIYKKFS